jgi:hypothetical protein
MLIAICGFFPLISPVGWNSSPPQCGDAISPPRILPVSGRCRQLSNSEPQRVGDHQNFGAGHGEISEIDAEKEVFPNFFKPRK